MTVRFPRSMIRHEAAEKLLRTLNVEIVDEVDDELEAAARQWLVDVERGEWHARERPVTSAVRAALEESARRKSAGSFYPRRQPE